MSLQAEVLAMCLAILILGAVAFLVADGILARNEAQAKADMERMLAGGDHGEA